MFSVSFSLIFSSVSGVFILSRIADRESIGGVICRVSVSFQGGL